MPDDTPQVNPDPTPSYTLDSLKSLLKFKRIYTYRDSRLPMLVVNLTEKPLFVPYLGRRGWVLPPVTEETKDTAAQVLRFRPVMSIRKRYRFLLQMLEDLVGTDTEDPKIDIIDPEDEESVIEGILAARASSTPDPNDP